ncbi:uncharacterized protein H6S33_002682 [Morchella sextelata]|uniref:uncharacterized protein n=1 Tax=Morchella sextelata TaxID=1174677 RepID=UPI001D039C40|nr:uncharacterized protein H6S33_002682 [Morchella sextelata]KAH0607648.1 hypothetical protein H6S33_002682 [Morchella sextelata]
MGKFNMQCRISRKAANLQRGISRWLGRVNIWQSHFGRSFLSYFLRDLQKLEMQLMNARYRGPSGLSE